MSNAKRWAKKQPKEGETVLHCGHEMSKAHMSWLPMRTGFQRPDGTRGEAQWVAECNDCFRSRSRDSFPVIRGDGQWKGNAPAIYEPPSYGVEP